MQSSDDRAVRERKLPFPVSFDRRVVAKDGSQAVEVACFMGRGNPSPVAVPVRNLRNVGCGRLTIRLAWGRRHECRNAGDCCGCNQEECKAFHTRPSIEHASVNCSIRTQAREMNNWTIVSSILWYWLAGTISGTQA